ncbi:MAG: glutamate synthase-related protein, partial [Actinomycetota bacterium]|nr:glutamate synthase-related protein [Actinomycetota bacterium]
GLPLREGLHFVHRTLVDADLREGIRLIAAGKVATGFDMARCFALGADLCNSARAMMMALGCIQARRCHTNECPVGVATQDKRRSNGLVVADKATRVAQYHRETVANFLELVGSAGCTSPGQLDLGHVHRRIDHASVASYEDIYGSLNRHPQRRTGAVPEPGTETRVELPAAHGDRVRPLRAR